MGQKDPVPLAHFIDNIGQKCYYEAMYKYSYFSFLRNCQKTHRGGCTR